jgi:plasmid stabilization system protein ParE
MFEVKISPQAAEDLLEIKNYIENAKACSAGKN